MAQGPGKYDDLATYVRAMSQAQGVIVIVIGGNQGSGFSVQATPEITMKLHTLLRTMADQIEQDMAGG